MNHAQLRTFHAVALQGGFTKAAQALHITQPTVSDHIKALETHYGVTLFERHSRGVELTELGKSLLDITRRQFGLEQKAQQLLNTAKGLTQGRLHVGADAPYFILPTMRAFIRQHPGIKLSFTFGNSANVLQGLFERTTDIAVIPEIGSDERLHTVAVQQSHLVAFVDKSHRLASRRTLRLEELKDEVLVLREVGSTTRALFESAMEKAGAALGDVLEIGGREAVREAVAAGFGIGIVNANEFVGDERLHALTIKGEGLQVVEYVACLKEKKEARVVDAFFEFIRAL